MWPLHQKEALFFASRARMQFARSLNTWIGRTGNLYHGRLLRSQAPASQASRQGQPGRPAARGGPTLDDRSTSGTSRPCRVRPPLAAGLPGWPASRSHWLQLMLMGPALAAGLRRLRGPISALRYLFTILYGRDRIQRSLHQRAESCLVIDRHFGEDLAVYVDVCFVDGMHQFAIADAVHAGGGVDARDPQAAHVALAIAAITIHIRHRAHNGLVGGTEQAPARATMALGHLKNFFMLLVSGNATFYPGHTALSSIITDRMFLSSVICFSLVSL